VVTENAATSTALLAKTSLTGNAETTKLTPVHLEGSLRLPRLLGVTLGMVTVTDLIELTHLTVIDLIELTVIDLIELTHLTSCLVGKSNSLIDDPLTSLVTIAKRLD
jgi:hypothetical protein